MAGDRRRVGMELRTGVRLRRTGVCHRQVPGDLELSARLRDLAARKREIPRDGDVRPLHDELAHLRDRAGDRQVAAEVHRPDARVKARAMLADDVVPGDVHRIDAACDKRVEHPSGFDEAVVREPDRSGLAD